VPYTERREPVARYLDYETTNTARLKKFLDRAKYFAKSRSPERFNPRGATHKDVLMGEGFGFARRQQQAR
jgi:hypothetical protein